MKANVAEVVGGASDRSNAVLSTSTTASLSLESDQDAGSRRAASLPAGAAFPAGDPTIRHNTAKNDMSSTTSAPAALPVTRKGDQQPLRLDHESTKQRAKQVDASGAHKKMQEVC